MGQMVCTVLKRQGKSLKRSHILILLLNSRRNLVLGLRYRKLPILFKGLIEYFRIRVQMANSSKLLHHNMVILEVKEAGTTPTASKMLKTLMPMQEVFITIIVKPMVRLTIVTTSILPICLNRWIKLANIVQRHRWRSIWQVLPTVVKLPSLGTKVLSVVIILILV